MQSGNDMPLYGVCCYMEEMLHRPPSMLKPKYPDCNMPLSRYMVAAPRCYCFLTRYPFFSLHMKVLHMILGLERLDRIMLFMDEVANMPLGGGRGLSGRLDSRKLPDLPDSLLNAQHAQQIVADSRQETARQQQRDQTAIAVAAVPSMMGSHRSSMPDLRTVAQQPPAGFLPNSRRSSNDEWGTMAHSPGQDHDVFQSPRSSIVQPEQDNLPNGGHSNPRPVGTLPWHHMASPFEAPAQNPPTNPSPPHVPPPHLATNFHSTSSAPAGPLNGFPATPDRQPPAALSKSNLNSPQQAQQKSPSTSLARASARMRVALEASQAVSKASAGPADPPPRQPGLPRGNAHRRTHSQQVRFLCMSVCKEICLPYKCNAALAVPIN